MVGGKVEVESDTPGILEKTIKREIKEEVGIEVLDDVFYVESKSFTINSGEQVIDIVFLCRYKSGEPVSLSEEEVAGVSWLSLDDILASDKAPYYLKDSIKKAEMIRLAVTALLLKCGGWQNDTRIESRHGGNCGSRPEMGRKRS